MSTTVYPNLPDALGVGPTGKPRPSPGPGRGRPPNPPAAAPAGKRSCSLREQTPAYCRHCCGVGGGARRRRNMSFSAIDWQRQPRQPVILKDHRRGIVSPTETLRYARTKAFALRKTRAGAGCTASCAAPTFFSAAFEAARLPADEIRQTERAHECEVAAHLAVPQYKPMRHPTQDRPHRARERQARNCAVWS